jgi:hypothetical protein
VGEISFENRSLGWGFLDQDCVTTCVEENISVETLPVNGAYELFAHYYSDHGLGPTQVRAEVFQGGARVLDRLFTMTEGQEVTIAATIVLVEGQVNTVVAEAVPHRSPRPRVAKTAAEP